MKSYSVTLDVDYFFEAAGNVSGGMKKGIGYADQRAIQADIALDKFVLIPGLAARFAILNRAGNGVSAFAIGDRLFSATETPAAVATWPCTWPTPILRR